MVYHSKGVILRKSMHTYVDQLDSSSTPWTGIKRELLARVNLLYGLNEVQYVNLIVRGHKDTDYLCRNQECNESLNHKIGDEDQRRRFCNNSCRAKSYNKLNKENGTHAFQMRSTLHTASRNKFLKQFGGRDLTASFYLTRSGDFIKFGITTDGYGRSNNRTSNYDEFYNNIHIIRIGTVEWIAELEYLIKSKLNPYNQESTEIIHYSQLKELLEIIKHYK